jgi:hypothetical protein
VRPPPEIVEKALNIAQAQDEAKVQPHCIFDNSRGKTVAHESGEILAIGYDRRLSSGIRAVNLTMPAMVIRRAGSDMPPPDTLNFF